jgi:hypothetical protein
MSIQEIQHDVPRTLRRTSTINPLGLSLRLMLHFIWENGKMVPNPDDNNAVMLFRHSSRRREYLVQLVSAQPSADNPRIWKLEFSTTTGPKYVFILRVEAPRPMIKPQEV